MLIPRLLRVGGWMLKELSKGRHLSISGTRHTCQCWRTLFKLPSEINAFQGSAFLKYRQFSTTAAGNTSDESSEQNDKISVTFVDKDGEEHQIKVPIGMSLLEAAPEKDIDLEGACEGSVACSSSHVIVMDMDCYNKLEDPNDEENAMLDVAFGLTETFGLGCQIVAKPEIDGIRVAIRIATRNFAVDGYVPKPR
uniref:Adrenodoxin-like ferredoxin 1-1 n=1 Tax=Dimocarpus longan TaxID=128017 RepID=G4Y7E4_9ROSI|nr:adrenodoxin-like ferredoxin 1-1 [Dimocarpus longan]AEQ54762.1 adrenodoxin-like ferredoxin 1-2 [Dimocarpus longan]